MTLDQMYDEMDLYGFDDFEDEQKLLLLNEAYLDIVTREPWPFMEKVIQFTAPIGTTKITNNAVLTIDNVPNVAITDLNSVLSFTDMSNDVVLQAERGDVVEKNYKINSLTSYPEIYYFVGEDIFVYPAVDGSTVYRLYYIRTPQTATDTGQNTDSNVFLIPPRHHSIIVYGALVKAFLVNDDPQAAAFQNMFEQRYQQMRNDAWMQQYDRTDRIHVLTDSYDWNY